MKSESRADWEESRGKRGRDGLREKRKWSMRGNKKSHMDVKLLEPRVEVQTWQWKRIQESPGRKPGSDQHDMKLLSSLIQPSLLVFYVSEWRHWEPWRERQEFWGLDSTLWWNIKPVTPLSWPRGDQAIKWKESSLSILCICLLWDLYAGQETIVRTRYGTMDWFQS